MMQVDWFLVALAIVVFIVGGYGVVILINDRLAKREPRDHAPTSDEKRAASH
jgi:uncharacterized membrane protein YqhA